MKCIKCLEEIRINRQISERDSKIYDTVTMEQVMKYANQAITLLGGEPLCLEHLKEEDII